ncbi:MAG: hypothetical protein R3E68_21050 [Burkholderiaceae bacterium]
MNRLTLAALGASVLVLSACATQGSSGSSSSGQPAGDVKLVKSTDGSFEGEVVGTIRPDSKFAKLRIGMLMSEVNALIKAPDDLTRNETGKRWIPFYFGNDAQRLQAYYPGEGCLTYTGGNVFGGGDSQLIRITVADSKQCME